MAEGEQGKNNKPDNAHIGYQIATNLWVAEAQMLWSKFNALLVANSIILITFGATKNYSDSWIILLFGIGLCILWFLLLTRSWHQHEYYIKATRQIEENFLPDFVATVSNGNKLSKGEEIKFKFKEGFETFKIPWWGKLKVRHTSYIIIGIFALIYIVLLRKKMEWLIEYLIGGEPMWEKWLQVASVIFALAGTFMLAFGLRVIQGLGKEVRKQIKTEGLISPSEVRQRKTMIYIGLVFITIAAISQIWKILVY